MICGKQGQRGWPTPPISALSDRHGKEEKNAYMRLSSPGTTHASDVCWTDETWKLNSLLSFNTYQHPQVTQAAGNNTLASASRSTASEQSLATLIMIRYRPCSEAINVVYLDLAPQYVDQEVPL